MKEGVVTGGLDLQRAVGGRHDTMVLRLPTFAISIKGPFGNRLGQHFASRGIDGRIVGRDGAESEKDQKQVTRLHGVTRLTLRRRRRTDMAMNSQYGCACGYALNKPMRHCLEIFVDCGLDEARGQQSRSVLGQELRATKTARVGRHHKWHSQRGYAESTEPVMLRCGWDVSSRAIFYILT